MSRFKFRRAFTALVAVLTVAWATHLAVDFATAEPPTTRASTGLYIGVRFPLRHAA